MDQQQCAARAPLSALPGRDAHPSFSFKTVRSAHSFTKNNLGASRTPPACSCSLRAPLCATRTAYRTFSWVRLGAHRLPASPNSSAHRPVSTRTPFLHLETEAHRFGRRAPPVRTPQTIPMARPPSMRTADAHAHRQRAPPVENNTGVRTARPVRVRCAHRSSSFAARPVRVIDAHRCQRHLSASRISGRLLIQGNHHRCLPRVGSHANVRRISVSRLYAATIGLGSPLFPAYTVRFPISPLIILHQPVMAVVTYEEVSASWAFNYSSC